MNDVGGQGYTVTMDEDEEMCDHEKTECPKHEGNWDCHSFCRLCEGYQEYCKQCDV